MTPRNKSMGELHKLIRDFPVDCSRQCNKPGALLETMVSVPTYVSATQFAAQRKAFRAMDSTAIASVAQAQFSNNNNLLILDGGGENSQQAPIVNDLKYMTASFQEAATKRAADRRKELRQKNKELHEKVQLARHRSSVTMTEFITQDERDKTTKIQYGIKFDPLGVKEKTSLGSPEKTMVK